MGGGESEYIWCVSSARKRYTRKRSTRHQSSTYAVWSNRTSYYWPQSRQWYRKCHLRGPQHNRALERYRTKPSIPPHLRSQNPPLPAFESREVTLLTPQLQKNLNETPLLTVFREISTHFIIIGHNYLYLIWQDKAETQWAIPSHASKRQFHVQCFVKLTSCCISGSILALIEQRFVISLFSWIYITQDYINNGIQKNIFTWRIHLIHMSKNCCNYVCGWTAGKTYSFCLGVWAFTVHSFLLRMYSI